MEKNNLEGRKIGEYFIHISEIKKGRFSGESTFVLLLKDRKNQVSSQPVAAVRYFQGTREIRPWMELSYSGTAKIGETLIDLSIDDLDITFFKTLSELIPPGGHIMVKYLDHPDTSRALTIGIPPAATPLGYLLWKSGFRWFKDWYFPEGGKEGDPKLQANKPLTEKIARVRVKEIAEELKEFLNMSKGEADFENNSRKIALKILREIELQGSSSE